MTTNATAAPVNDTNNGTYGNANGAGYSRGAGYNEKPYNGGGHYGNYGPLAPADGYGPLSDDPVSYQRYFTRIANPGPTYAITVSYLIFYSDYSSLQRDVRLCLLCFLMVLLFGSYPRHYASQSHGRRRPFRRWPCPIPRRHVGVPKGKCLRIYW